MPMAKGAGSRTARGLTTEETSNVLAQLRAGLEGLAQSGYTDAVHFRLSLDNARAHTRADMGWLERVPLPVGSPDIHKVVEHCHAIIKARFTTEWSRLEEGWSPNVAMQLLQRVAQDEITPARVAKDVATLKDTYAAVIEQQGGWPARKFR